MLMSTEASQVGEGQEYVQHGVVVTVVNYRVCAHLKRGGYYSASAGYGQCWVIFTLFYFEDENSNLGF